MTPAEMIIACVNFASGSRNTASKRGRTNGSNRRSTFKGNQQSVVQLLKKRHVTDLMLRASR